MPTHSNFAPQLRQERLFSTTKIPTTTSPTARNPTVAQHGLPERAMLRQEEDRDRYAHVTFPCFFADSMTDEMFSCRPLQGTLSPDEGYNWSRKRKTILIGKQ
jgi:hypothetical protein